MKLLELFDNPSNYKARESGDIVDYESTLSDGSILEVEFYKSLTYSGKNNWFLSFSRRAAGTHSWSRSTDKTNMGNEVDVMSTVVGAAKEFCQKYKPDTLQFVAAKVPGDPRQMSRANLYKRMAQRLGGNAYDVRVDEADPEAVKFIMVRKGFTPQPRMSNEDAWGDEEF